MLVIYHTDTGQIRQTSRNTPKGDVPPEMIPEGCAALKTDRTDFTPQSHRVDAQGRIIKKSLAVVEAQEIDEAWRKFRQERDAMLFASDWTQVPDAPVDQSAWATYRQELRDLPANTQDPRGVVWPTPPA